MNETELYKQNVHPFQEAVAMVEDPRQKGMYIMSDDKGQCFMVRLDPSSGRLSRHDIVAFSATIQTQDGVRQQVGPDEVARQKMCIFIFGADFGSKEKSANRLLPKKPGAFQVYTLREGLSKPIPLSASVCSDCQLDLTAIGVADYETNKVFGLRAVFPGSHTHFGVVAITTCKDILSLWYWKNLQSASSHTLPTDTNEDKYNSLVHEHQWSKGYEKGYLS